MMWARPYVHIILFGWTWNNHGAPVLKLQIYLGYLPWTTTTLSKLCCTSAVLSNSTLPKQHCTSIALSPFACYICSLAWTYLCGKPQIKKTLEILFIRWRLHRNWRLIFSAVCYTFFHQCFQKVIYSFLITEIFKTFPKLIRFPSSIHSCNVFQSHFDIPFDMFDRRLISYCYFFPSSSSHD